MNQPLSFVHSAAKIANNVVIEPFVTIHKNVEIGEGTWIGSNVTIMEGSRIGNNCKIFPGAVIGAVPQDLKFKGEETTAEIGNNTTIREFVTINRGTSAKGKTIVGSNCLLMAYVHIAHDCIVGDNVILVNGVNLGGEVIIDDYAIISANSLIHQFCRIGAHTMLAGNSLVGKDVPPYVKAARYPLSYAGVNSIGLRRRNFCNNKINAIQDIYRVIFSRGMNVSQSVAYIEAEMPASKERDEILLFIRNSKRGIIKGYFDKSEADVNF
ncbi:MAG: acyl-ACP--UDP-N-acetylglucosamine O-acyltransferase [Bacteroidales bacterium]|nr:acyl-ACP--UDP-N-acetylglucosamine O-acyltransferase [Bacteroidales bacterium]MCK9498551.1 acyl-ACP--UDP-N-acetylglucosamine O-acyltransferase [Bacteroidales bacterium]MDY0314322.1 acyl-ACP--UDP-N-acetylglucosamine O-acyltransferase [Bacteroidales bacterium]NLB86987.1 acyl-ACP--UDP-N-acetylglucosamine O-acyltransferase [Bacteroidales bacterium]NLB87000.1 acyl-ACP--UDP-N-acetylglucosamine O-acyltransferase [Bacteroidales bacterium]